MHTTVARCLKQVLWAGVLSRRKSSHVSYLGWYYRLKHLWMINDFWIMFHALCGMILKGMCSLTNGCCLFLEVHQGSTETLEKVSISSPRRKTRGIFSLCCREFSKQAEQSSNYSSTSTPSVIQYTDNVFMVERQSGDQVRSAKNHHNIIQCDSIYLRHRKHFPSFYTF